MNNKNIEDVQKFIVIIFLGVIPDQKLKWTDHKHRISLKYYDTLAFLLNLIIMFLLLLYLLCISCSLKFLHRVKLYLV